MVTEVHADKSMSAAFFQFLQSLNHDILKAVVASAPSIFL